MESWIDSRMVGRIMKIEIKGKRGYAIIRVIPELVEFIGLIINLVIKGRNHEGIVRKWRVKFRNIQWWRNYA